jgi:hypothetical protein
MGHPVGTGHPIYGRGCIGKRGSTPLRKISEKDRRDGDERSALPSFSTFCFFKSPLSPFTKGGVGGLKDLKRAYLMKRLFQFSNLVWKISLEGQESKIVLEKELTLTKSLSHSAIGHSTT